MANPRSFDAERKRLHSKDVSFRLMRLYFVSDTDRKKESARARERERERERERDAYLHISTYQRF
jgi:hypothetical protein